MTYQKEKIWEAIDQIAKANGGLIRVSLDSDLSVGTLKPTPRDSWPSLRTICKILDTYGMTLSDFDRIITYVSASTPELQYDPEAQEVRPLRHRRNRTAP